MQSFFYVAVKQQLFCLNVFKLGGDCRKPLLEGRDVIFRDGYAEEFVLQSVSKVKYLQELSNCQLCEHRCGVNRLEGEVGVCRMTLPMIASATLHPAPPQSYTIFMAGCNFKCLNCQNWSISQYPDNGMAVQGMENPEDLAKESIYHLRSHIGQLMRADRIFFSGGEPTIHLPYIVSERKPWISLFG